MLVKIDYHPSPPQRRFHDTKADEVMYGGEIGGGKTAAIVMDALVTALKHPGVTLYLFRATYQQGEDTILEEIERAYPKDIGRYNKDDTTFYYINGSKLKIRQCNTMADAMKNDGKEFSKLYIDEAQHLNFDVFDYLCLRPRANKSLGVEPQVKFTAMQGGKGHTWINSRYVKPLAANEPKLVLAKDSKTGEEHEMYRQFIPASLEDNKHIDDKYAGRLSMRSEKLQRKARTSDWNAVEGQVFKEWVDKPLDDNGKPTDKWTHVVKEFPIPDHWPIYRGYDYGRSAPYSTLWLTRADSTYNNRLFIIAELYGGKEDDAGVESGLDETVSQQGQKIAAFEKPLAAKHGWIDGVADPSIFQKSPYADESIASVLEDNGVYFRDPRHDPEVAYNVINNRLQGVALIHEALLFDAEGYPGVQIFDTCANLRKHIPELVSDPKNPDDVLSVGTNDHDYDAFRLLVMLTKPKVKMPVSLPQRARFNPLGFSARNTDNDDNGKVIQMPDIIIGARQ